jgi:hypothetical protein
MRVAKKWFLILLLASPVWLMSQETNHGTISFDFNKKKKPASDSASQQVSEDESQDTVVTRPKKKKQTDSLGRARSNEYFYDYRKDGLFYGLFHVGFNAAQVDGDNEYGYKYFGAEGGIGAMARFDKIFSLSLELNYSMKGAKARLQSSATNLEKYMVAWDYIEAPIAVNAHYKKLLVFSIGVDPGYQARYKELDYDGINITNNYSANVLGQPRKIDLCGFGGMQVIIKEHYSIGGTYSYSMIKIRRALPGDRVNGEYNNYLTFDFKYILGRVKKK